MSDYLPHRGFDGLLSLYDILSADLDQLTKYNSLGRLGVNVLLLFHQSDDLPCNSLSQLNMAQLCDMCGIGQELCEI